MKKALDNAQKAALAPPRAVAEGHAVAVRIAVISGVMSAGAGHHGHADASGRAAARRT